MAASAPSASSMPSNCRAKRSLALVSLISFFSRLLARESYQAGRSHRRRAPASRVAFKSISRWLALPLKSRSSER